MWRTGTEAMINVLAHHAPAHVIVGEADGFGPEYALVFDGPQGRETTIGFDEVVIDTDENRFVFYVYHDAPEGPVAVHSSSIGCHADEDLGDVTEWLLEVGDAPTGASTTYRGV